MTREPSLSTLMDPSSAWASLENIEQNIKAQTAEQQRHAETTAMLFHRVFNTPDGRQVLEHLLDWSVRRQVVPHVDRERLLVEPATLLPFVLFREGQNALVTDILQKLRQAEAALKREATP